MRRKQITDKQGVKKEVEAGPVDASKAEKFKSMVKYPQSINIIG